MIHDTHCHLMRYSKPEAVLQACCHQVESLWIATASPEEHLATTEWLATHSLKEGIPRCAVGLGLHPQLPGPQLKLMLPTFLALAPSNRLWNEIGLDGAFDTEHQSEQQRCLEAACELLRDLPPRILSLHARRASTALMDMLAPYLDSHHHFIWHWFSGTEHELKRAVEMGFFFSINPGMTGSRQGRLRIRMLPPERCLLETDGPYTTYDHRPAEPVDLHTVIQTSSGLWGMPRDHVAKQMHHNLELFK